MRAFDFVTAWLAVEARQDDAAPVCREGSMDYLAEDHSQARFGAVQQAEAKDDKAERMREDVIDYVADVYGVGLAASSRFEKSTAYSPRACLSRRWRRLVFKKTGCTAIHCHWLCCR